MAVSALSALSRVCPACGRRVAPPAMSCRCGKSVEGVTLTAPPPRAPLEPPPDTSKLENAAKIAVATVAILAGVFMIYRALPARPAAPKAANKSSSATSGARAPASVLPPAAAAPVAQGSFNTDIVLPAPAAADAPATAATLDPPDARAATSDLPQPSAVPLESLVEHAMPGVVMVQTEKGRGSGFLVRPDLVATNAHVTKGFLFVTVTSQTGVKMQGRVAQFSEDVDVALVQVGRLSPTDAQLPLGTSAALRLGQGIVALGWAQSDEQHTVNRGVITGLRQVGTQPMIQTDAAPHPGDSGGPVLDRTGQVVGITTIRIESASSAGGLAVPIDYLKPFLDRVAGSVLTIPRSSVSTIVPGMPDPDSQRSTGLQRYSADVASIAARADSLDGAWHRYRVLCKVTSVPPGQTREWFGLYDPTSPLHRAPDACPTLLKDLQRQADAVRAGMIAAGEMARHADVVPGDGREIRRRYRLDFLDWDR
jgi:S1-C subfamily serine protease